MGTLRDAISSIRSRHKLLSTDDLLTDRAIAEEIQNNAIKLIRQQTNLRKLWATDTLFTTIPCLEMQEVPITECCSYKSPLKIARSKFKLPRISEGYYQYLIQGVYDIESMKKFMEITPNRYINLLGLKRRSTSAIYYWISNNYLYVTSPEIKRVKLVAFFEEPLSSDILNPTCECAANQLPENCTNPLDMEFRCPGFLLKDVLDMASQILLQTYARTEQDNTQNNLDEQVTK